jgi:chemotaxis protein methyltransferase CheR
MSLAEVAEIIRRETGITPAVSGDNVLRAALRRAAPELEPAAFVRAAADPVRGRDLVQRLIDEVTVQETTFVRDRAQLDSIPWPSLLHSAEAAGSAVIRVWSAGCATGEEPYTLALLAAESFASARPPVDVLGTDISGRALAAAAAGRYRERAVRALDARLRLRYLERQADDTYLVGDPLRRLVRYRRHNLARDPLPPLGEAGFDLIICRNVLIYFEASAAERVLERLDHSLRPGGKLLLGAADALRRTVRIAASDRTGDRPPASGPLRAPGPPGRLRAPGPGGRHPAVPRARQPVPAAEPADQRLTAVLVAAGKGDRDRAVAEVESLLRDDPLHANAQFVYGLMVLEAGEPDRAAAAFRRALYADPGFALAAFALGCAHDALGDNAAARRAYQQALRTLDPADERREILLQQIRIGDIATACQLRLRWHQRP